MSELRGGAFLDKARSIYEHCLTAKAPIARGPMATFYPGSQFLEIEVLVLALSDDGVNVNCLFGAFDGWPLRTHTSDG